MISTVETFYIDIVSKECQIYQKKGNLYTYDTTYT